ncbi:MAG: malectin domain-containing carbohydrate-binding protein, partial [Pseudomonadota bacterium]
APSNNDNFHEITRSDDLEGRSLSVGAFGAPATFTDPDGNVQVYGGHPNPTRAEGALAGLLFSPNNGVNNAYLLVSSEDSYGNGSSDFAQVIAFLEAEEASNGLLADGELTDRVIEVDPGVAYDIYTVAGGGVAVVAGGTAPAGGIFHGTSGLPADIADIVSVTNEIEGDYLEGGRGDGALDSGKGSINGLAEYTSTIFDDGTTKMSGAILATSFGGSIVIMGRNEDGTVTSVQQGINAKAADRSTYDAVGKPLGISVVGDDFSDRGLVQAFQGSVWTAVYQDDFSGVSIEILQPNNGAVPLAGSIPVDPDDADFDGVDKFNDPFEFSADNGYALAAGQTITLDFDANSANFGGSISGTGLLGAALDGPNSTAGPLASAPGTDNIQEAGATANQDARTGSYLTNAGDTEDPSLQRDGLFDLEGNIIPGGNAPILQIKEVVPGTMVGAENTARDALHTGIRPDDDVKRISATMRIDNWIASAGAVAAGQLTGMTYGDGTQSNFLRLVFGEVNGQPGIEVGYEIGDANYTKLAELPVAALSVATNTKVDLRLEISDIGGSYSVAAQYRVGTSETIVDAAFIDIELDGGNGFDLPEGVLRDVLDGTHTITSGDTVLTSGAAIGVVAETTDGNPLNAIDIPQLDIEAFGNEIIATTEAEAEADGTSSFDTVVYTGGTADIALAASVENFDGSGSTADYDITANELDNRIDVGEGANVITTGDGADTVRGTLAELDGDDITDFSEDDQVVIEGATLATLDISYAAGTAIVGFGGGRNLTFSGPDFDAFEPAAGDETFDFKQISGGVVLTRIPLEQLVVAVNAGTTSYTFDVNGEDVTFLADQGGSAPAAQFVTAGSDGGGGSKIYNGGGSASTVQAQDFGPGALSELHWDERSSAEKYYGYEIPVVENGTYRVDIYSAEIFHGVVGSTFENNKRVFDVVIEGETVADNFDHFDIDPSAPAKEIIHSYEFEITDGAFTLDIDARGSAGGIDQPKLSA